MEDNKYIVPMAIIIAGALITWGIFANKNDSPAPTENTDPNQEQPIQQEQPIEVSFRESDHILGNPEAKIKMITFSDFECPYCKTFHETMIKITDEYAKDGRVAWTFRQFPVHGEPTQIKAAAAECAELLGGESKFWEMSEKIYETTSTGWITVADLPTIAKSIGLNENDFNTCLKNPEIIAKVQSDFQNGRDLGVEGTPFTAVIVESGEIFSIPGAQSYEDVKNMIEMILNEPSLQ